MGQLENFLENLLCPAHYIGEMHLTMEQLERFITQATPLSRLAEVEEHLIACEYCQERAFLLEDYAIIMRHALVCFLALETEKGRSQSA